MEIEFKGFEANTQLAVLSLLKQGDKSLNKLLNITNDLDHHRYISSMYIGRVVNELCKANRISKYEGRRDGVFQIYCHIEELGIVYRKFLLARHKRFAAIMESYIYYDPDTDYGF